MGESSSGALRLGSDLAGLRLSACRNDCMLGKPTRPFSRERQCLTKASLPMSCSAPAPHPENLAAEALRYLLERRPTVWPAVHTFLSGLESRCR